MDPRDEQKSLAANPLPPEHLIPMEGDDILPSRIVQTDMQIADLEQALMLAREARKALMDRAIALNVGEDPKWVIIKKEKLSNRVIDPELFKKQKPEAYEAARQFEIAAAQEKIQTQIDNLSKLTVDNAEIRVKTVETLLTDDEISAICRPRTVTVTYDIIKAGTLLPKGTKKLTE